MTAPKQKPGKSRQDYATPWEFIVALQSRWGALDADLAASESNAKAPNFLSLEDDSLIQDWSQLAGQALWLNPPFADIDPWAERCATFGPRMMSGRIYLLTPASVGSTWFARHVHRKALVLGLSPRITFEGETDAYPKDLILSIFGPGLVGFDLWRWKTASRPSARNHPGDTP